MIASAVRRLSRNSRARGRRAASGRNDAGLTLIEAIIATAIVATAVAATAAALSAASKSRFAAKERALVAEIANEVLAEAEAVGCGLPPDFEGISGTDRLSRCDDFHGTKRLADVDFTMTRDGISFDVEVRMRWFAPGLFDDLTPKLTTVGDPYNNTEHLCSNRAEWASGLSDPTDTTTQDADEARQPTILERRITVTSQRSSKRSITTTSHQAIQPPSSDNTRGYMIGPTSSSSQTVKEAAVTIQNTQNNPAWIYELQPDDEYCVWFPFLSNTSYYITRTGATTGTGNDDDLTTDCPKSAASDICYHFHEIG